MKAIEGKYIYRRGKFDGGSEDVLVEEDGWMYLRCPYCVKIVKFKGSDFSRTVLDRQKVYTGPSECVVCSHCTSHFFIAIESSEHKRDEIVVLVRKLFGRHLGGATVTAFEGKVESLYATLRCGHAVVIISSSTGGFTVYAPGFCRPSPVKDFEEAARTAGEIVRDFFGK